MTWRSMFLGVCLVSLAGCSSERRAEPVQADEKVILFSLDPRELSLEFTNLELTDEGRKEPLFHDYVILGQRELTNPADRQLLMTAFKSAVESGKKSANCFEPRHGLRVVNGGKSMDYQICFSCKGYYEFGEGADHMYHPIADDARETFNKLLKDAGIPLHPKKTPPGRTPPVD